MDSWSVAKSACLGIQSCWADSENAISRALVLADSNGILLRRNPASDREWLPAGIVAEIYTLRFG